MEIYLSSKRCLHFLHLLCNISSFEFIISFFSYLQYRTQLFWILSYQFSYYWILLYLQFKSSLLIINIFHFFHRYFSATPEILDFPGEFRSVGEISKLILISVLRPDRFYGFLTKLISEKIDENFLCSKNNLNIETILKINTASLPLIFFTNSGIVNDILTEIEILGKKLDMTLENGKFISIRCNLKIIDPRSLSFLPPSFLYISSPFYSIHFFPLLFYAFLPPSILYISYNLYVLIKKSSQINCFIFHNFVTYIYNQKWN